MLSKSSQITSWSRQSHEDAAAASAPAAPYTDLRYGASGVVARHASRASASLFGVPIVIACPKHPNAYFDEPKTRRGTPPVLPAASREPLKAQQREQKLAFSKHMYAMVMAYLDNHLEHLTTEGKGDCWLLSILADFEVRITNLFPPPR